MKAEKTARHALNLVRNAGNHFDRTVQLVAEMKGAVAALKIESGDIIELWELVSTARHGDGPAAMRLSSLNPDLWSHQDASAQVEYSRAGLRAYTIRVNDSDLERYLDATIDFWESASRR
jgi:hypothetical protein